MGMLSAWTGSSWQDSSVSSRLGCLFLFLSSAITHSWYCSVPHTQRVSAALGRDDLCGGWPRLFLNIRQHKLISTCFLNELGFARGILLRRDPASHFKSVCASTYLEVSVDSQECQGFSSLMLSLLPPFHLLRLLGFLLIIFECIFWLNQALTGPLGFLLCEKLV